jgi:hypothetical protein
MSDARYQHVARRDVGIGGEVLIASINLLAGAYVVFAKCGAAALAGETPTQMEALRVHFRLTLGTAADSSWCYLIRGPGIPDPICFTTLNVAYAQTTTTATGGGALSTAHLYCQSGNGAIEVTNVVMTAIPVDSIRP